MRNLFIVNDSAEVVIVGSEIQVTGALFNISLDRLVDDEFYIDNPLCSEENLTFGKMESGHLEFTLINDKLIPNLEKTVIKVYEYDVDNVLTIKQLGRFTVDSDEKSTDRSTRIINAYDDIYYLRDYDISAWYYGIAYDGNIPSRTCKWLRDSLFAWLNDTSENGGNYPITQQTVDLVNDGFIIYKGIESDVITFDFFMSRLIELNGAFGHISNTGVFEYITLQPYSEEAVHTFTPDNIIPPVQFEDYSVWGIGYVDVYDRDNIRLFRVGDSAYAHPSRYRIIDSFVFADYNKGDSVAKAALSLLRGQITHRRYTPFEAECVGETNIKLGDRVDIESSYVRFDGSSQEDVNVYFYSYALEMHREGIQQPVYTYGAKGKEKQPKYKLEKSSNWHVGDSTEGTGTTSTLEDDWKIKYIKAERNNGIRYLQEPSNVHVDYDSEDIKVNISWTDPSDITNYKPEPQTWAGTVVVRKEGSEPWYIWDGEVLVDSTTRDEYSETPFVDDTIEINKQYYYGIFPYSILDDSDPEHIKKRYRFTKVLSVNTSEYLQAPIIESITAGTIATWNGTELAILWSGDENSLTVQIADEHIVFKMYSGETLIYTITSPVGSDVNDIKKIHIAFLEDENNHVAKPSFVYHTSNGYSYNQEEPTDAEMGLIYTWLQGGES